MMEAYQLACHRERITARDFMSLFEDDPIIVYEGYSEDEEEEEEERLGAVSRLWRKLCRK